MIDDKARVEAHIENLRGRYTRAMSALNDYYSYEMVEARNELLFLEIRLDAVASLLLEYRQMLMHSVDWSQNGIPATVQRKVGEIDAVLGNRAIPQPKSTAEPVRRLRGPYKPRQARDSDHREA